MGMDEFCARQWLQSTISNIIVSGKAILSGENSEKHLSCRSSVPNPAAVVHSAPPHSEGCCPFPAAPQEPHLRPFGVKNHGHALVACVEREME